MYRRIIRAAALHRQYMQIGLSCSSGINSDQEVYLRGLEKTINELLSAYEGAMKQIRELKQTNAGNQDKRRLQHFQLALRCCEVESLRTQNLTYQGKMGEALELIGRQQTELKEKDTEIAELQKSLTCCVCLAASVDRVSEVCGHAVMCSACCDTILAGDEPSCCPVCRTAFDRGNMLPVKFG